MKKKEYLYNARNFLLGATLLAITGCSNARKNENTTTPVSATKDRLEHSISTIVEIESGLYEYGHVRTNEGLNKEFPYHEGYIPIAETLITNYGNTYIMSVMYINIEKVECISDGIDKNGKPTFNNFGTPISKERETEEKTAKILVKSNRKTF